MSKKPYIQEGYSSRYNRSSEDVSNSDPDEGITGLQLQESGDECSDQRQRGSVSSQAEERDS